MIPKEAYLICLSRKRKSPDLEVIISTNPQYSYLYARDVIKGRWEEGENIIATHIYFSYCYAKSVLKSPFHLGHPIIFSSPFKDDYLDFLKYIKYDLNEIGEWLI
jgi:hypothetical protein